MSILTPQLELGTESPYLQYLKQYYGGRGTPDNPFLVLSGNELAGNIVNIILYLHRTEAKDPTKQSQLDDYLKVGMFFSQHNIVLENYRREVRPLVHVKFAPNSITPSALDLVAPTSPYKVLNTHPNWAADLLAEIREEFPQYIEQ